MLIYRIVAGETYCGIATLSLLERLPPADGESIRPLSIVGPDQHFVKDVLSWLVYRQTTTITEEEQSFEIFDRTTPTEEESPQLQHEGPIAHEEIIQGEHGAPLSAQETIPNNLGHPASTLLPGVSVVGASPEPSSTTPLPLKPKDLLWIGFNGRCNKFADTCYCFWAGGTLGVRASQPSQAMRIRMAKVVQILEKAHFISFDGVRRYLLEKTQHIVGGFGKLPGDPPGKHSFCFPL